MPDEQGNLTDAELSTLSQQWGIEAPKPAAQPAAPTQAPPAPILAAPLSQQAFNQTVMQVNAPPTLLPSKEVRLQELGAQPGVKFHEEGLGTWDDLMVKLREDKEAQIRYLAQRFGTENVRLNELDEPVIRMTNPDTGQPEDYPVNPHQMTANSFTGLARFAPDIAGAALALKGGGKVATAIGGPGAKLSRMGTAVLGAAGAETAGGIREGVVAGYDRPFVELPEALSDIAGERAKNIPVDVALDYATWGLAKGGQYTVDALRGKGVPNPFRLANLKPANQAVTEGGLEGKKELLNATGIDIPLSFGESTGIPFLQQAEVFAEAKPAGAGPLVKARLLQEERKREIQKFMMTPQGTPSAATQAAAGVTVTPGVLPGEEATGRLTKAALEASAKPELQAADEVRKAVYNSAHERVLQAMDVQKIPTRGVPKDQVGDLLGAKIVEERNAFRATQRALYDPFNTNPLTDANIVDADVIANPISKLIRRFPRVEETVTTAAGPATQERVLRQQIPPGIQARLEELASMKGGKTSLTSLKELRTTIGNSIQEGMALTGQKNGYLEAAYAAASDAIEAGLKQIGDPTLTAAWNRATKFTAQNAPRLENARIASVFKEASQAGAFDPGKFVDQAIGSEAQYKTLAEFFGKGTKELNAFYRAVKLDVLHRSLADGVTQNLDGAALAKNLRNLRTQNPTLYKDVFGSKGNVLISEGTAMDLGRARVSLEDADKLLDPKSKAGMSLRTLAAAEQKKAILYQNQVVAKFLKGDMPASDLKIDDFIRFLPEAKLSDVRDVVSRIATSDPGALELLQRKSVQALLQAARREPTPSDVLRDLKGEVGYLVSGSGLQKALGLGDQGEKMKLLLGPDLYNLMINYAKVELVSEEKRAAAAGVGMLVKGQAIGALERALTPGASRSEGTLTKEITSIARDKAVSWVLANPKLRNWITMGHKASDMPRVFQGIVTSEPFIEAALEEFKNDIPMAYRVLGAIKQMVGVDRAANKPAQAQQADQPPPGMLTDEQLKTFQERMVPAR